ncbi:GvpL/GvpF family gas vesicle protein [Sphaerisporangium corydalis]|uniref:GvpL/GvpF family gas vesicle protein n=1 Tax=Sphaerisporangium corydalis TaxID=1441875 RepID=A0ABV9EGB8_9ACTN|nr:GvpL/GvpF family gas vesicle protein [Sphaerisporangium corydalis]
MTRSTPGPSAERSRQGAATRETAEPRRGPSAPGTGRPRQDPSVPETGRPGQDPSVPGTGRPKRDPSAPETGQAGERVPGGNGRKARPPERAPANGEARRDGAARRTGEAEGASGDGLAVASYIYGVLPGDIELTPEARGVGDPPGEIRLVRHQDIAALVSDLHLNRPLGKPQDLMAHQHLLDDVAAEVPVLPLRFGAVMESPEAIVREFLVPHHDEFRAALESLEGRAQYVVKARYEEGTVLREVLQESPEAAELRDRVRGMPEDATWDARIRLGEIINEAIEAKRDADTQALAEGLAPHAVSIVIREPTHEEDAAHLAALVETAGQEEFEKALDEFGRRWAGRVTLRLLGPQAPYDFVSTRM